METGFDAWKLQSWLRKIEVFCAERINFEEVHYEILIAK
jgi:hypothetical protein